MENSKNPKILIEVARAHLPTSKKQWYVNDHLLKDLSDALERLIIENKYLREDIEEMHSKIKFLQRKEDEKLIRYSGN